MPPHDSPLKEASVPSRLRHRRRRRIAILLILVLILLVLNFLPPLLNVSRFQRRIASNIGASIGRPVHFDRVALSLLPLPGVVLTNFVVDEDPAFGYEPILRAGEVRATLRISSLWRRRIEFSKISLSAGDAGIAPNVNLVHTADGRWNLEPFLLQAARIQAAPTAQRYAGPAPRFPYIEATGARVDLKFDRNGVPEKTPFSLTDADFALWLPEPHQWRLRLEARPIRTDTAPPDAGTVRIEGTLGAPDTRAASLADLPIDLHGDWRDAQLGGLSRLLLARDAGLRGGLTLEAAALGTIGRNTLTANLRIDNARRADFVPAHPLSLQTGCTVAAAGSFHSFSAIDCRWPPAGSSDLSILILSAAVPDVRDLSSAYALLTLPALPADTLLDWLGVATPHPPTGFTGHGTLSGSLAWHADRQPVVTPGSASPDTSEAEPRTSLLARAGRAPRNILQALLPSSPPSAGPLPANPRQPTPTQPTPTRTIPAWTGDLTFSGESLQLPAFGPDPIPLGDLILRSTQSTAPPSGRHHAAATPPSSAADQASFDLLPIELPLDGKLPATLEGHFDRTGYTLHLTGNALPARLFALGDAVPQFGDGLRKLLEPIAEQIPIHLDLTATRTWGGPQLWRETTPPPPHHPHK
jgi:AsmA-like protein